MEKRKLVKSCENESERKENFLNNGFIYDDEYCRFVKEGYGAFLSNISAKDIDEGRKYIQASELFNNFINEGYNLVVGPAAPADNGIIYGNTLGVYIVNYKDKKKVVTSCVDKETYLTNEELDRIVSQANNLARGYETVSMHCMMGLNLGDVLEQEARKVFDFEKKLLDTYNDFDIYNIICRLEEQLSIKNIQGKKQITHMITTLSECLYERVVGGSEFVSSDKIDSLVTEACRCTNNYKTISVHTSLGLNLNVEHDKAIDDIHGFISKVTEECSVLEMGSVVKGILDSYNAKNKSIPEGASFIVTSLKRNVYDKVFKDYFEEEKQPKVKK